LLIRVSVNPTVLVVEDDPQLRQILAQILMARGYRALTADGVEAAAPILRDAFPDVLLVDVRLGAFNGLQLVAMAERPIPTIVMTGHDDVALRAAAERMGAEFLVKPIPSDVLIATVQRKVEAGPRVLSPVRR
jgi:DNA-binding NtrC family response regulator